jgi:hypothetical protein
MGRTKANLLQESLRERAPLLGSTLSTKAIGRMGSVGATELWNGQTNPTNMKVRQLSLGFCLTGVGFWKAGKQKGKGTFLFSNGDKYIGDWKKGKRHGTGNFYWIRFVVLLLSIG